jgi:hypothetical protein
MVNKIRVFPARAMVKQWLTNFRMTGPIECTSLVTHIISNMGILEGNPVPFIEDDHVLIDEFYLVQGNVLKKGPNDSMILFSLSYSNKILLPNVEYHLCNCRSLTTPLIPQEVARRHSVSSLPGRITRSRARREEMQQPQPQPSHQHEAGGSSWQSASSSEWARESLGRWSTSSSSNGIPPTAWRSASSRGFSSFT